jgi:signal transduction histidine kinase
MARRIREHPWADTPLGPLSDWPAALARAVDLMLGADAAISIYWGPRHILLYNDAWRAFIGDRHPAALGRPARALFPEIWDAIGPKFEAVLGGAGAASEREQHLRLKRRGRLEDTWFDYSFNPIPRADGAVGGVFNIGTEVTDRVVTRAALRQSETFHRLAAEAATLGLWSIALDTGDAVLSPRMAELMGYAPDEYETIPGTSGGGRLTRKVPHEAWMASVHPDDRAALREALADARDRDGTVDREFRIRHDGGVRWLYARGEVTVEADGRRVLRGASLDITRRQELEEALVTAGETVRHTIGVDLHDSLCSDLAALAFKTTNLRAAVAAAGDGADDGTVDTLTGALDEVAAGLRTAAAQSRRLAHALMPVALQEEHLAAALDHLCREQGERERPLLRFEGDREEPLPANKETAMHLYHIARTAVADAQRRAGATRIGVRLAREADRLVLTIRDDGTGRPDGADPEDGLERRTMAHRARLVGATLRVDAADDGGTVVRCTLPRSRAEEA